MKYHRDHTTWGSYDGRVKKIKDIDNDHLLNIIHHIRKVSHLYDPQLLLFLIDEAKFRNINPDDTLIGQIPHQNAHGDWVVWDYETFAPKKIS